MSSKVLGRPLRGKDDDSDRGGGCGAMRKGSVIGMRVEEDRRGGLERGGES